MSGSVSEASWQTGSARFVFGQGGLGPADSTVLSNVLGRITTYYRKHFNLAAGTGTFTLRLLCDDGAVVYLNGTEVHRQNMPEGTVTHSTRAITSVEGASETEFAVIGIPLNSAVMGDNLLAVEVHDSYPRGPGDVSFDAALTLVQSPVVSSIRNRTTLEDTTTLPIIFDAEDSESPGGKLEFSLECSPSWKILNESVEFGYNPLLHQRYFTVTPGHDVTGDVTVTLRVSDGSSETRREITITVTPVDDPPTIDSIGDIVIVPGQIVPVVNCILRDVDTPDDMVTAMRRPPFPPFPTASPRISAGRLRSRSSPPLRE